MPNAAAVTKTMRLFPIMADLRVVLVAGIISRADEQARDHHSIYPEL
jgi:hypothetical protein